MGKSILVTGSAGFIGYHVAKRLTLEGHEVFGIDNLNNYYDPDLKQARLNDIGVRHLLSARWGQVVQSSKYPGFSFMRADLTDRATTCNLFAKHHFHSVVHLSAQAGVLHSLEDPWSYIDSNILGSLNVLEGCRSTNVRHLVFASSSSVYGLSEKRPSFSVLDNTDKPASLYGATKKSLEVMAYAYSNLYNLPATGLRLFTVYGPWGRPDMAIFRFVDSILKGVPIHVFNHGIMARDFTYIDDVVESVCRVINHPARQDRSGIPYRLYNVGRSEPVSLATLVQEIEKALGKEALMEFLPFQNGDTTYTCADVSDFVSEYGYRPKVSIPEGVALFVDWYRNYYGI